MTTPSNTILHHLCLGISVLFLIGWFYLMRQLELMEWAASLADPQYNGSLNLLAMMVWMTPALLLWKYYLRFINKKLNIKGRFYEDEYYKNNDKLKRK